MTLNDGINVFQELLLRLQAEQVEVGRSEEFQRLAQILINNMYLQRQQLRRPASSSASVSDCLQLYIRVFSFGIHVAINALQRRRSFLVNNDHYLVAAFGSSQSK